MFTAKHVPVPGSPGNWRVYDVEAGSFPYERPGLGRVKQDTSQAEAEAEAFRLNHPDARPEPVAAAKQDWDFDF